MVGLGGKLLPPLVFPNSNPQLARQQAAKLKCVLSYFDRLFELGGSLAGIVTLRRQVRWDPLMGGSTSCFKLPLCHLVFCVFNVLSFSAPNQRTTKVIAYEDVPSLPAWTLCEQPLCPVLVDRTHDIVDAPFDTLQVSCGVAYGVGGGVGGGGGHLSAY